MSTTLGDVCKQHGWGTFEKELCSLFEQTDNETIERHARILADLSSRKDKNSERSQPSSELGRRMTKALTQWETATWSWEWRARTVDRSALVACLAQSFLALDEPKRLEGLIDHVLGLPEKYPLTEVQIPTLAGLRT